MTTLAVTGASGYLGRVFIKALASHPGVGRIIGIDTEQSDVSSGHLEFYRMDVRSPDLAGVLEGCDVVVHLGFTSWDRDDGELRDVNLGGTRLLLEASVTAGVKRFILGSSTTAYGAHPDNDFPLTELSVVRPLRGLAISAMRAEIEEIVTSFAEAHDGLRATVVRVAMMMGPSVRGTMARLIESPYVLGVTGYDPPVQIVHEDDAGRALVHVLDADLDGTYNVAPDDSVALSEALRILGHRLVSADQTTQHRQAERLWRMHLSALPPEHLPFVMYPWVTSNGKLRQTGFDIRHTTLDALGAGAEARKGWVTVGPTRFRPKRLALIAGTVGAVLLGSAARRSRRAKA